MLFVNVKIESGGIFGRSEIFDFFRGEVDLYFFEDFTIDIGIEGGIVGHGDDGAGFGIHDYSLGAVDLILFEALFEEFFELQLHGSVDCKNDIVTVDGGLKYAFSYRNLAADGVFFGFKFTSDSLEIVVETAFDSVLTDAFAAHVAYDICCEGIFRVVAEIFFFHAQSTELSFVVFEFFIIFNYFLNFVADLWIKLGF